MFAKNNTIRTFLSIAAIHFCPSIWQLPYGSIQKYTNVTSLCNGSIRADASVVSVT